LVLPIFVAGLALFSPATPPLILVVACAFSPLAAAFFGHAARRHIRKDIENKSRGYVLAGVGVGLAYFEIVSLVVILFSGVHHPPRIAMYEAATVGSMRTINLAAHSYAGAHPQEGFPRTLKDMARDSDKDWSIDEALASGVKSKYRFTYVAKRSKENGTMDAYQVFADPVDSVNKDMRHFFTDQTEIIRYSRAEPANESSEELK